MEPSVPESGWSLSGFAEQVASWAAKPAADVLHGAVEPAAPAETGGSGVGEGYTCQLSRSRLPRSPTGNPSRVCAPPALHFFLPADMVQRIIAEMLE